MAHLVVEEEVQGGVRVVALRGELDMETSPRLAARLAEAAGDRERPLVVDLTECAFIDSTGLAALFRGTKRLQDTESNVAVVCPDNIIRQLLRLSALDQTLPVFDTRERAIAAVVAPG